MDMVPSPQGAGCSWSARMFVATGRQASLWRHAPQVWVCERLCVCWGVHSVCTCVCMRSHMHLHHGLLAELPPLPPEDRSRKRPSPNEGHLPGRVLGLRA